MYLVSEYKKKNLTMKFKILPEISADVTAEYSGVQMQV